MSDPFLDLSLIDNGVEPWLPISGPEIAMQAFQDLLGLYRSMPQHFNEPDSELPEWLAGPMADMTAMVKEGFSREEAWGC